MVVVAVVVMSAVVHAVAAAVAGVEVWPDYLLPQFLELQGPARCAALVEARALRQRWQETLFWRGPFLSRAELAHIQAAALTAAATAASAHFSASTDRIYFVRHVWESDTTWRSSHVPRPLHEGGVWVKATCVFGY